MTDTHQDRTVGILAFDAMEVLDFAGPYEVFNVAGELAEGRGFHVRTIGVVPGVIEGRGGFAVQPHDTIATARTSDVLVVPGGAGSRALARDAAVVDWVRTVAGEAELVLSVCTGSLVLAAAGLLAAAPATTHHTAFDALAQLDPSVRVVTDARYVQSSERIWTSAGVSAGVDLSLRIVRLLAGDDLHDHVVEEMEWGWRSANERTASA